ncbi:MAG: endonuclease domain-containing protein [Phenylobacterium sp.]
MSLTADQAIPGALEEDGREFVRLRTSPNPTRQARGMRRRMTWSERRLWRELKKLDLNFRRQAPIGRYFADFACHGRRLVIEVDGGVHERLAEVAARDVERQQWLEGEGYKVLRFTDRQVADDLDAVIDQITALFPECRDLEALLLDGGGLGGGASAEATSRAPFGADAYSRLSPQLTASTTIPNPSSIEEEGRRRNLAGTEDTGSAKS